ncbi:hypothetical protein KCU65_g312, partial [Aureobasidium melanogenum]
MRGLTSTSSRLSTLVLQIFKSRLASYSSNSLFVEMHKYFRIWDETRESRPPHVVDSYYPNSLTSVDNNHSFNSQNHIYTIFAVTRSKHISIYHLFGLENRGRTLRRSFESLQNARVRPPAPKERECQGSSPFVPDSRSPPWCSPITGTVKCIRKTRRLHLCMNANEIVKWLENTNHKTSRMMSPSCMITRRSWHTRKRNDRVRDPLASVCTSPVPVQRTFVTARSNDPSTTEPAPSIWSPSKMANSPGLFTPPSTASARLSAPRARLWRLTNDQEGARSVSLESDVHQKNIRICSQCLDIFKPLPAHEYTVVVEDNASNVLLSAIPRISGRAWFLYTGLEQPGQARQRPRRGNQVHSPLTPNVVSAYGAVYRSSLKYIRMIYGCVEYCKGRQGWAVAVGLGTQHV